MPNDWSLGALTGPEPTTDPFRAVAKFAAGQWGVVSHTELLACGVSEKTIKVLVRKGHLHPLHRGVYAVGHRNVTTEGRFLAAVKACGPEAVLSHYAAACLHCLLKYDGRFIDVTAPTKRKRPTIRTHRSDVIERVVVKQIPVTPRLRTVIDLARTEDERTVTRALRAAKFTEAELGMLPRGGKLGKILNLSAAPTASHAEDVVLDLVLKSGLEHPEVNAPDRVAGRLTIPDLRWPEQRLIVEVDSREWHSDPLAQRDDADRQAALEAQGWRVLRVTTAQARRHPQLTIARLRAAGAPAAA